MLLIENQSEDIGKDFVQITYFIESDDIKVHLIFDLVHKLIEKMKGGAEMYPKTTHFLSTHRLGGDWRDAKPIVTPAFKYFNERLVKLGTTMKLLQACRRFDPHLLSTEMLSEEKLRAELGSIPCLQPVEGLIADYPKVRLAAADATSIQWWAECPFHTWREAALKLLASVQRVLRLKEYFQL